MRYEVRVDGVSIGVFEEPEDAVECVAEWLAKNPGHEPEIIDMQTGKAFDSGEMEPEGDAIASES